MDFAHRGTQAGKVFGITVDVWVAGLVEKSRPRRHHRQAGALRVESLPGTIGLAHRLKPDRQLHSRSLGQLEVVPVCIPFVEGPPNIQGIDAQSVQDLIFGLGQLLDDVVNPRVSAAQPQVLFKIGVSDG